jgi:hypothetical protein
MRLEIPNEIKHTFKNQEFTIRLTYWEDCKDYRNVTKNQYVIDVFTLINGKTFWSEFEANPKVFPKVPDFYDILCEQTLMKYSFTSKS